MTFCTRIIAGLPAGTRVPCVLAACLLGVCPALSTQLAAQETAVRTLSGRSSFRLQVTAPVLHATPSAASAAGAYSLEPGSAQAGAYGATQGSGLQRVVEMLIDSEAGRGSPDAGMPGLGSVSSTDRFLNADLPVELGFYSSRATTNRAYLEQLTIRNAGIAASRRLGATRLYLGAGLEQLRTDFRHPDIPYSRDLFSDPMTPYEHAMVGGREAFRSAGFTPRVTLGAGLELSPLRLGADLSVGSNPAVSLASSLSIF